MIKRSMILLLICGVSVSSGYSQITLNEYLLLKERKNCKDSIESLHASAKYETGYTKIIRIALGSCYNKLEEYTNSIKQFKKAAKFDNLSFQEKRIIYNGLGNSYYYLNKYKKSTKYYGDAIGFDSTNAEANLYYALSLYKTGQKKESGTYLNKVPVSDLSFLSRIPPENIFYEIANIQFENNKFLEAKKCYSLAINKDSQAEWNVLEGYYLQRSRCYYWLKEYDSSDYDLTTVISRNHANKYAYCSRAYTRFELGDYYGVINDVNACLGYYKTGTDYYIRGQAYEKLKEYDKALSDYAVVVKSEYNDHVYVHIADTYMGLNQSGKAIESLNTLINKHPSYSPAYFARGRIYFENGDFAQSCEDIKRAIELGNKRALEFLESRFKAKDCR